MSDEQKIKCSELHQQLNEASADGVLYHVTDLEITYTPKHILVYADVEYSIARDGFFTCRWSYDNVYRFALGTDESWVFAILRDTFIKYGKMYTEAFATTWKLLPK